MLRRVAFLNILRHVAQVAAYLSPWGRLAQMVERLVYTEEVGGSIPSPPTMCFPTHEIQITVRFIQLP